jgi:hypothetical protein
MSQIATDPGGQLVPFWNLNGPTQTPYSPFEYPTANLDPDIQSMHLEAESLISIRKIGWDLTEHLACKPF